MINLADNFPFSPPPGAAAHTGSRAGSGVGVPPGDPLCGYHAPSSGCTGLDEEEEEEEGSIN